MPQLKPMTPSSGTFSNIVYMHMQACTPCNVHVQTTQASDSLALLTWTIPLPSCCNFIPRAQDLARTFPNSSMWTSKCLSSQNPFTATSLSMSHSSFMDAGTSFRIPCSRNRFATIIATDPETLSETSVNCAEPHVA